MKLVEGGKSACVDACVRTRVLVTSVRQTQIEACIATTHCTCQHQPIDSAPRGWHTFARRNPKADDFMDASIATVRLVFSEYRSGLHAK